MSRIHLGKLEPEALRKAWPDEALDFTPWLAQAENLADLGNTIGIDLELVSTEQYVGPFRADILCRDTTTGRYVLIENQLEATDHTHLGQLLTYAAGLKAMAVVWLARKFTDEHRATLDWLNEITKGELCCLGLEIELWRIGDSAMAPKLNIVCQPNEWTNRVAATHPEGLTDLSQFYLEYWTQFKAYVDSHTTRIKARQPYPQYWTEFAVGRAGFAIQIWMSVKDKSLDVNLAIKNDDAKRYFHLLLQQKAAIESALGQVRWQEVENGKWSYISQWCAMDPATKAQWPEQFAWLLERVETFRRVFEPILKSLHLESPPVPAATNGLEKSPDTSVTASAL